MLAPLKAVAYPAVKQSLPRLEAGGERPPFLRWGSQRFDLMSNYYVYILQSLKDGKYYIGHTGNLMRRLEEHNLGKTRSLRNRRPLELIYVEKLPDRLAASSREKQIKSYKGGDVFKRMIERG